MIWNVCFFLSVIILLATVVYMITLSGKYKRGKRLKPFNVLVAGVFVAIVVGLLPVSAMVLKGHTAFVVKSILFAVTQTFQVFTVNLGADLILDNINASMSSISGVYSTYMIILFFLAQILTFSFVVSLFKNAMVSIRYRFCYFREVYIFSKLNDKSLMLARDLRNHHRKAAIIFTDVDRDEGNIISEYVDGAQDLNALLFKKNVVSIDFDRHSKNADITFFVIDEKENENIVQALKIITKYKERKNTSVYVFSSTTEGELLLSNADKGRIKVRRVNEIRSLIYRYLYNEGEELFDNAISENEEKVIRAAIIGLGCAGKEMVKALSWYCQMDEYNLDIRVIDKDELAEEKFANLCPELIADSRNPEEKQNFIIIYSGIEANTRTFAKLIKDIGNLSFVFICMGTDEDNINQAAAIRMLCERNGCKPVIRTMVYNTEEKDALIGITNFNGGAYDIRTMGDLQTIYSEDVLLGSELELLALGRHLKWGKEEDFWKYEYNYRSSMAAAIHLKARISCHIPGADKAEENLSIKERDIIERLEHRRWNMYMRSEGYVYSGSPERSSRNDLAKVHHDLVDFDTLSETDKRKDSSVGTL